MLIIGLTGSIATGKSTVSAILGSSPNNIPVIDADVLAREVVEPGTRAYRQIVEYFGPVVAEAAAAESASDDEIPGSAAGAGAGSPSKSILEAGAGAGTTNAEKEKKKKKKEKSKNNSDNNSSGSTDDLLLPPSTPYPSSTASSLSQQQQLRPLNRATLSRLVFGSTPTHALHRRRLNSIVHPAVRRAMVKALLRCYLSGCWAVVLDVPLLFESGWDVLCGTVVVVAVWDKAVQMRRLCARDGEKRRKDDGNVDNTNDDDDGDDNVKRGGEEEEEEEEKEVKGRIGSQGGMLDKVARVLVREGLDTDIEEMVRDGAAMRDKRRKRRGVSGRGWGVVLWNDDDDDDDDDDEAENDYTVDNDSDDDNNSHENSDTQTQKMSSTNEKQRKRRNQINRLRKDVNAMVRQLERQSPQWWAWTLLACPPLAILVAAYSCARSYWARKKWEEEGKGNERLRRRLEEMERDMLEQAKL